MDCDIKLKRHKRKTFKCLKCDFRGDNLDDLNSHTIITHCITTNFS